MRDGGPVTEGAEGLQSPPGLRNGVPGAPRVRGEGGFGFRIQVGPAVRTVHQGDRFVVSDPSGEIHAAHQQGFFAADTRLVSDYRFLLGGRPAVLSSSAVVDATWARFEHTTPALSDTTGRALPAGAVHLRLDRRLEDGRVEEAFRITSFSDGEIQLDLAVRLVSDFADLFDVRNGIRARRGIIHSVWEPERGRLVNSYATGRFRRGLAVEVDAEGVEASYANGELILPVRLAGRVTWAATLRWVPLGVGSGDRPVPSGARPASLAVCAEPVPPAPAPELAIPAEPAAPAPGPEPAIPAERPPSAQPATLAAAMTPAGSPMGRLRASEPFVTAAAEQARADLLSLRLGGVHPWVPAAGVPWFLALFGRDALVTSLQAIGCSYRFAEGSLDALAELQGRSYDDDRDCQPGKIPHELRLGELASLGLVPHTPYYGTHDATPLFVLVAVAAWRWSGDRDRLDRLRPKVEAALAWLDRDGDPDGDGLQEYATRSTRGYRNQGWKDASDAILHADGSEPALPIALCELQGLAVAAKRAWSAVLEDAYGERRAAARLRSEAERLADAIEARFWWEEEGSYYLGLDGAKQPIRTVASNPGHLLWAGAVEAERAGRTAARLLASDLWSGWGIRTLSSAHPAYNPFSYQLGSVWPHDNVLIAEGLRRYGFDEEMGRVARGVLEAAARFERRRLPELFAGLARDEADFPVQVVGANVPQAWASGAVLHLLILFLGLEVDLPAARLRIRPSLPEWLDEVSLEGAPLGRGQLAVRVWRGGGGTIEVDAVTTGLAARIEPVVERSAAPARA